MRIKALLIALALACFASPSADARPITPWEPPPGMAWDGPHQACNAPKQLGPLYVGCFYGPSANPKNHVGRAFFRVCGIFRQSRPFLVVDFSKKRVVFYTDPTNDDSPSRAELLDRHGVNPERYLWMIPDVAAPCWTVKWIEA